MQEGSQDRGSGTVAYHQNSVVFERRQQLETGREALAVSSAERRKALQPDSGMSSGMRRFELVWRHPWGTLIRLTLLNSA